MLVIFVFSHVNGDTFDINVVVLGANYYFCAFLLRFGIDNAGVNKKNDAQTL